MNGLQVAAQILAHKDDTAIVFVTAFRHYAVEAFDIRALDYLLKPLLQEKVDRAVSRIIERQSPTTVTISNAGSGVVLCFGTVEVFSNLSNYPIKWRTTKVEEMFYYLLYNRETAVPKSKLIDILWDDDKLYNVDSKLHTTMSILKKALKEAHLDIVITFSSGAYRMNLGESISCDVDTLKTFIDRNLTVTEKTIEEFQQVAVLYRGDFFQNKDYRWCIGERIQLQRSYLDLIKKMVLYFLSKHDYKQAESILHTGLGISPLEEDFHELMLKIHFLQDNRITMVKHFEYIEALFHDELGVEIRPDIRRLYEKLLTS